MIEKKVKKLWKGEFIDIRDYEIPKAIKKGGMIVYYNGKHMTLTVEDLSNMKLNGQVIQSKYSGTYKLCSIKWSPETENPNQEKLF
tara:strand:- start:6159 stop:6416 length:258 start_codon:yes stop_codon:yes gene_type:complete